MAINIGTRSSFEDRTSVKDNIDDRLDFLTPTDVPFLSYIGFASDAGGATSGANSLKFPCTQERHLWFNDDLVPSTAVVDAAYSAAGGTLTLEAGQTERFQDDDIIMVNDMVALVTATTHGSETLTITELHNSSDAAVGDTVHLLGNARVEGLAAADIESRSLDFGSTENFTQIFAAVVRMTGTEMATERWGVSGDPYQYQLNKRLKELGINVEKAALYNRRNASYPSTNATARRFGGLAEFIRDNADANVTNAGGADLDEIMLNDLLEDVWEDGGMPDTIMVGSRQKRAISSFLSPYIRVQRTESTAGVVVGTYESDFGSVDVVMNRWMKPSDLIVLTKEFIGIGPLAGNGQNRAFFVEELPKDGDYIRSQVIGEYTMEVRNATKAHGWLENLSVS